MSKARMPGVAPASRPKGGDKRSPAGEADSKRPAAERDVNAAQVGQPANTRIATTHQGRPQGR